MREDGGRGQYGAYQGTLFTSGRDTRGLIIPADLSWAPACVNLAHLTSLHLGNEKICRADKINCLVYTAHTDTHSYTNSHVHCHAWMPLAANTVLTDTHMNRWRDCSYTTLTVNETKKLNNSSLKCMVEFFFKITDTALYLLDIWLDFQHIMHSMLMLIQCDMVNINMNQSSGFRAI